ncbi:hypothetical protein BC629DRAFT_1595504 [Irpex lacteus]|nr:hypothetical protein BC629DRAFT_1595504 [Irpex lacteus]
MAAESFLVEQWLTILPPPPHGRKVWMLPPAWSRIKVLRGFSRCDHCKHKGVEKCFELWNEDAALRCLQCMSSQTTCYYTYWDHINYSLDSEALQSEDNEKRCGELMQAFMGSAEAHANLCHEQRILSQGEQTLSLDGTVKTMEQREGEISALMDTVSGKLKKMHALFTDMCECVVKIQDLHVVHALTSRCLDAKLPALKPWTSGSH